MNKRIQMLADIAFINHLEENPDSGCVMRSDYTTDFAEMIIRECMELSLKNSHRDDDMGAIIARQIKEHFGVEE